MSTRCRKEFHLLTKRRIRQLTAFEIKKTKSIVSEQEDNNSNIFNSPQYQDDTSSKADNSLNNISSVDCGDRLSADDTFLGNVNSNNILLEINTIGEDQLDINMSNIKNKLSKTQGECLKVALQKWVILHNISQTAVTDLLKLLKSCEEVKEQVVNLPNDCRSLMNTPRASFKKIRDICGGRYAYFSFAAGVKNSLLKYFKEYPADIKVNINIDGLPLSKSSGSQFWPILASLVVDFYTEPFVVGIFWGLKKPNDVNLFLQAFVDEALETTEAGIDFDKKHVNIAINAIICDAPAKAFISCIKSHNGYFGCSKCIQEGNFTDNRVTFPEINSTLRSDQSFKNRQQIEHHTGDSYLEQLNIGMVSQIPIDYMHLVCLGVVKRLLQFWIKGKLNTRIKRDYLNLVSDNLVKLKACITTEFARKPRSLLEIDRWKATELRQFLLYTGPVVLKDILDKKYYLHFLSLSVAIRILIDRDLCLKFNIFSKSLLIWFVQNYGDLYGKEHMSYNVHNLIHLPNDVQHFGSLDNFSSFKYENFMQKLKNKLVPNGKPLEQIVNRISEDNQLSKSSFKKVYPIIHYKNILKDTIINSVEFEGFQIFTKPYENICLLDDNSIVAITRIYLENDILFLDCKYFTTINPFFEIPCDSRKIGIWLVLNGHFSPNIKILASSIKRKCCQLETFHISDDYSVIFSLMHFNN